MSTASLFGLDDTGIINPNTGWINVKEQALYPVYGNGVNDDTVNVQAIIFANPGKTIYFPTGVYLKTAPWVLYNDNGVIQGDGSNCSFIKDASGGLDPLVFYCLSKATKATFVNGCGMSGITLFSSVPTLTGAFRITQCNQFKLNDCIINNMPEGIIVSGGQLSKWDRLSVNVSGTIFDKHLDPTSALITYREAPIDGGLFQPCFTQKVSNFDFVGSFKVFSIFRVENLDGLQLNTGYVEGAYDRLWNFTMPDHPEYVTGNFYIAAVTVSNVYHDQFAESTGTNYGVYFEPSTNAGARIYDVSFTGGFIGNAKVAAVVGRQPVASLILNGVQFANLNSWLCDMEGDDAFSNTKVVNCTARTIGSLASGSGALRCKNQLTVSYLGNTIITDLGLGSTVKFEGTIHDYILADNTHISVSSDYSQSGGTVIGRKQVHGNLSNDTNPVTSINDAGVFTPTVTLGGAAVGLTYSFQHAEYTKQSDQLAFVIDILLTAKGASAGAVVINGLPFVSTSTVNAGCVLSLVSVTAGVGTTHLTAKVMNGTSTIQLFQMNGAGAEVALTDADITNTSRIQITGRYKFG